MLPLKGSELFGASSGYPSLGLLSIGRPLILSTSADVTITAKSVPRDRR